ncbi:uncharacterized protein VP01_3746g2 [Puccinia sorghi]|uniref:Uncharacterized protein n=1 Tax=Puccinia sorghi TaxID=27349 RepID=A0A0L6UTV9_9BASI|nr:uncharacterized protein VP01_3746g2 [Puccinia sorghi]
MLSFLPIVSTHLPRGYQSFTVASSCFAAWARSRPHPKSQVHPLSPTVIPPKDGNTNSPDDRVMLLEVKKTVLDLLEKQGPMSRRKIYDDHLSQIYPIAPFVPNSPTNSPWHRRQSSSEKERVYLTMSKLKDILIRNLVDDGVISLMTVRKIQHLVAAIDESRKKEDQVSTRVKKLERVIASESETTFVWILNSWLASLNTKCWSPSERVAKLPGRTKTASTQFKNR